MPCFDSRDNDTPRAKTTEQLVAERMAAVLCSLTCALGEAEIIRLVDWTEAGVSQHQFQSWWHQHQREDAARRQREAEARRRAALREEALALLTPEQRAALGLK